jgi:hypothetical protein
MFSTDPLTRRIPTGSYPCGTFYETFDRIQLEECHSGTACCRQTDDMHTVKLEMLPAPCASAFSLACGTRYASRGCVSDQPSCLGSTFASRINLPPLTQRRRGVKTTRHIATAGVSQGEFSGLP